MTEDQEAEITLVQFKEPEEGSDSPTATDGDSFKEEPLRAHWLRMRGILTNAICWSFWGDEERQIINLPPHLVDQARTAAERCLADLESYRQEKMAQSTLIKHARRELELCREDPEMIEWYLDVILAFTNYGHSGGSASTAIPVINDLLQFRHLTPLTRDPEEWMEVGEGVWQNRRNSAVFSQDGGQTHYFVDDPPRLRLIYDTVG